MYIHTDHIYICIYNDYEKEQRRYMTEFGGKIEERTM